ncbi:hypothetical protein GGI12_000231 [Dipsacomyces acuminosporus]|nr:hypothetical protein GGI12_000231 [Dipsacomyces acuminosporus]
MAPRQKSSTSNGSTGTGMPIHSGRQSGAMTANTGTTPKSSSRTSAKYTQLDFNTLNIQILRKYRQVFKLNVKARSSKEELVGAAARHFSSHIVDEVDTIARFLYTVHSNKSKASLIS